MYAKALVLVNPIVLEIFYQKLFVERLSEIVGREAFDSVEHGKWALVCNTSAVLRSYAAQKTIDSRARDFLPIWLILDSIL